MELIPLRPHGKPGSAASDAPLRVLVVDDSADSAESLALLLALDGYETRVALSGADASRLCANFAPQLVLLDVVLSDIDGCQLARKLRALPQTAQAMLVAMTCYGDSDARDRAAAAGCDEYFPKPFEPNQLSQLARRAATRARWAALFSTQH
jgi:CheY-like chemotaxis protein